MDVAEELFSRSGPDAISVRDIANAANVNLAAVNYHFGSKENLFKQVFERTVRPCNHDRLQLLDKVLADTPEGEPPVLRDVLYAFYAPLFRLAYASSQKARVIVMVRYLSEAFSTLEGGKAIIEEFYEPIRQAFVGAMRAALPDLPLHEVVWRYNSLVGVSIYAMGGIRRMSQSPHNVGTGESVFPELDVESALDYTLDFIEAGCRAPSRVGRDRPKRPA